MLKGMIFHYSEQVLVVTFNKKEIEEIPMDLKISPFKTVIALQYISLLEKYHEARTSQFSFVAGEVVCKIMNEDEVTRQEAHSSALFKVLDITKLENLKNHPLHQELLKRCGADISHHDTILQCSKSSYSRSISRYMLGAWMDVTNTFKSALDKVNNILPFEHSDVEIMVSEKSMDRFGEMVEDIKPYSVSLTGEVLIQPDEYFKEECEKFGYDKSEWLKFRNSTIEETVFELVKFRSDMLNDIKIIEQLDPETRKRYAEEISTYMTYTNSRDALTPVLLEAVRSRVERESGTSFGIART